MLKKHEVKEIITRAFEELHGMICESKCENESPTITEVKIEEDDNGDLILTFKEDYKSEYFDRYRIKVIYEV